MAQNLNQGDAGAGFVGLQLFHEGEDKRAADFSHDSDDVRMKVFFGFILEIFDEEGGGELTGGHEVLAGIVISAGAIGEAFNVGADAGGIAGNDAIAFFEAAEELRGDILEFIALHVLEHDLARVAAVGGFLESIEKIGRRGVGVDDGLAIGLGEFDIIDDGVVEVVVGEGFEGAGGSGSGVGGSRRGGSRGSGVRGGCRRCGGSRRGVLCKRRVDAGEAGSREDGCGKEHAGPSGTLEHKAS